MLSRDLFTRCAAAQNTVRSIIATGATSSVIEDMIRAYQFDLDRANSIADPIWAGLIELNQEHKALLKRCASYGEKEPLLIRIRAQRARHLRFRNQINFLVDVIALLSVWVDTPASLSAVASPPVSEPISKIQTSSLPTDMEDMIPFTQISRRKKYLTNDE